MTLAPQLSSGNRGSATAMLQSSPLLRPATKSSSALRSVRMARMWGQLKEGVSFRSHCARVHSPTHPRAHLLPHSISLGVLVIDVLNQKVDGDFYLNPQCYPNVTEMVTQAREATGAHLMVSLWPDVKPNSNSSAAMQVSPTCAC